MYYQVLTRIVTDEEKAETMKTKAYGNNKALIFIETDSAEKAHEMLLKGMEDAREMMATWDGSEQEETEEQAPETSGTADEEQTPAYIEKSVKYCEKRNYTLRMSSFHDLFIYSRRELWRGIHAAYCVGYRRGRQNGLKHSKAK